jgi:putative N-acetyltransferase (TIGR04045 family)
MLETTRPYGEAFRPYLAAHISYGLARERWELSGYWALRRAVFCDEQALFDSAEEERDEHDAFALPIVAVAHSAGTPERVVGAVRIFESSARVWYGGRLSVDAHYRARGSVGACLIHTAVSSAQALGCQRFLATVLEPNARYFARFHFQPLSALTLCGRRHVLMQADLAAFRAPRSTAEASTAL